MDVKTIIIFNDNKQFEEEVKKAISMGYEIISSNISTNTISNGTGYMNTNIIYYALIIKK